MTMGPIKLFRAGGGEQVFTGEASPAPGGGSLPTGWTEDASNPANVNANGGDLEVVNLDASQINASSGIFAGASGFAGTVVLFDGVGVEQVIVGATTVDPSANAGVAARPGSFLLRSNGQAWLKTGAADTDWSQVAAPAPPPAEAVSAVAANPVADDTTVNAAVQHSSGDALLDYTDPAAPTVIASGTYAVTLLAECFEGPQAGGSWNASVLLTGSSITTQASQDGPLTAGGTVSAPSITATAIGPLTAGDTITFPMTSYSGAMGTLNLNVISATIVKLA